MEVTLKPALLGLIIGTRAALAFGVGLLVASRIPESRRRSLALTLIGIGVATTVPLVRSVLSKRMPEPESPEFV
jgi:hypothetical protein